MDIYDLLDKDLEGLTEEQKSASIQMSLVRDIQEFRYTVLELPHMLDDALQNEKYVFAQGIMGAQNWFKNISAYEYLRRQAVLGKAISQGASIIQLGNMEAEGQGGPSEPPMDDI